MMEPRIFAAFHILNNVNLEKGSKRPASFDPCFEGAHVNTKAINIRKLICFHKPLGA